MSANRFPIYCDDCTLFPYFARNSVQKQDLFIQSCIKIPTSRAAAKNETTHSSLYKNFQITLKQAYNLQQIMMTDTINFFQDKELQKIINKKQSVE